MAGYVPEQDEILAEAGNPGCGAGVRRRTLLGAAAVGLGVGALSGWGPWPGGALSAAEADSDGPLKFVVLTDTHANDEEPAVLGNVRRVFRAVEEEDPRFVLHCGDISDYGGRSEFAAYRDQIPPALWDRIRHVPGNHEARWDESAGERYREWFGPAHYSFDRGGIHFVAMDPTQLLQEPGLFGESLAALRRDLRQAGDRPTVLFLHFPVGGPNYYINDTDALLRAIDGYPVRGIFAGHIHRKEVSSFNGLTQIAAVAVKNGPFYFRVTENSGDDGRLLQVDQVSLGEDDVRTVDRIADIPLDRAPGSPAGPIRAEVVDRGDRVRVRAAVGDGAVSVAAQVYPQEIFGGASDGVWTALEQDGRGWSGVLDAVGLAAGRHRIQLRAVDSSGARWEHTVELDRSDDAGATPAWAERIGGQLQGALAAHGDRLVAASTSGRVVAYRISGGTRHRQLWSTRIGAVHRGAAFSADGEQVYLPAADHRLYALDTESGRVRWRTDLGGPVLSAPAICRIEGADHVVVSAGDRLHCLDERGRIRWRRKIAYLSAGRPAIDDQRIYLGAGDGRGYAFRLTDGDELWSAPTTDRTDTYRRLIYGPWDDTVALLPAGGVLFSTVSYAIAVDAESGQQRWRRSGSYVYAPSLVVEDRLLMIDERGVAAMVDPSDGTAPWTAQTAARVLNAGPVLDPRTAGRAWVVGTGGLLVRLDLDTGTARPVRQLFTANTFSTPVLIDDQLVVGAQDGVLRSFTV